MKKSIIYTLVLILLTATSLVCQPRTGLFTFTYTDRGITSNIFFNVPSDYDSTKSYPFLLGWHGAGDNGSNMRNALTIWLAQRVGAILVCPDANNINGQSGDFFSNLTSAAYSYTRTNYNIDTNKIIVMGFSWGGAFSYQLGLLNPQLFKGIIGLAPAIGPGQMVQQMWDNIFKIRMATILGNLDFNYTAVNALMTEIKNRGANLLLIIKPGVQHVDNTYFNSQAIKDDFLQCYNYVLGLTDVEEEITLSSESSVIISPNPALDFISIKGLDSRLNYQIFAYNGILQAEGTTDGKIDVSHLNEGVYFIRLGKKMLRFVKL